MLPGQDGHLKRKVCFRLCVEPPDAASLTPNIHQAINQNMLFADPPNHTRLRSLVNLAFTPRRIARMAPQIQMIANRLLDQGQARGKMDLIADYAQPLPMMVRFGLAIGGNFSGLDQFTSEMGHLFNHCYATTTALYTPVQ